MNENQKTILQKIMLDAYSRGAFLGMITNQLQDILRDPHFIADESSKVNKIKQLITDALLVREVAEALTK